MLYLLYRIGKFISLTLPIKISYWIADSLGSLYYLLAKKDKKIVTDNTKVVLNYTGDTGKVSHTSRMVFVNFARYLVEFFRSSKVNLKFIKEKIKVEGKEFLDKALSLGKGVIIVSAHIGNWELGAMTLSILGYKINSIVWVHKNKKANDFFLQQRQSKGIKVIPVGSGIRKLFPALKNNEIVAILGDVDYVNPEIGIQVKFFGKNTIMPKGPARFSLKASSPIVPVFMLREKDNNFRLVLEEPIIYKPTRDREDDLAKLAEKTSRVIEMYVARYPEQWFMLTPRW